MFSKFFQNFLHAAQTLLDALVNRAPADAFCSGIFLFTHAQQVVCIDTLRLLVGKLCNGSMKFFPGQLSLVQFFRRMGSKQDAALNASLVVKRVIRLIAAKFPLLIGFSSLKGFHRISNLGADFDIGIFLVIGIEIPQIDSYHIRSSVSSFLSGEKQR